MAILSAALIKKNCEARGIKHLFQLSKCDWQLFYIKKISEILERLSLYNPLSHSFSKRPKGYFSCPSWPDLLQYMYIWILHRNRRRGRRRRQRVFWCYGRFYIHPTCCKCQRSQVSWIFYYLKLGEDSKRNVTHLFKMFTLATKKSAI